MHSAQQCWALQGYWAPIRVPQTRNECLEVWPLLHCILDVLDSLTDKHVQPYEGVPGPSSRRPLMKG